MNPPMIIQNQLLSTKFFLPMASGTLILRPRLTALLAESLKQPLTLVSAPAGFGKTTLLSTWAQSQQAPPLVAWVSLDRVAAHLRMVTFIRTLARSCVPGS